MYISDCVNKPLPVRLSEKDIQLIDRIVKAKQPLFMNRSHFIRFAIEKTAFDTLKLDMASTLLREFGKKRRITKKEAEKVNREVHEIRRRLMKRYYK